MTKQAKPVWAQEGHWSYRRRGDRIIEYTGVFSDFGAARGTSRFVHHRQITPDYRPPEEYSDGYVVRLRDDWGDKLDIFHDWAMKHDLLPALKQEEQMREHEGFMRDHKARERYALAFRPAPRRFMRGVIDRLNWQMVEAGYAQANDPHAHQSLVMVTQHPQLAFQVAHYLYREGYMDSAAFQRVHQEIKDSPRHIGEDVEFRIAVDGRRLPRFGDAFPHAGECKPELDRQWLQRLEAMSDPERCGRTR